MKHDTSHRKSRMAILVCAILMVVAFVICLGIGRYAVPISQTARILFDQIIPGLLEPTWDDSMANVITNIRLPRTIAAALVGAALALSGASYQGLFKNPLVSPDLLGVSNGACFGAAVAILLGMGSLGIEGLALAMGLLTVLLTTLIPKLFRNSSSLMLVLSGVIVSGFMSALVGVTKYIADPDDQLPAIVYWIMGSFSTIRMDDVARVVIPMLVAGAVLLVMRWRINILSLGDAEARSLGVDIRSTRAVVIVCSTLLTASSVCLCGAVGWVGLVVPHLSRIVVGQDNRYVIPMSAIFGALFMVVVYTLARNLTGSEIPLSILTGLLGAPLFIWLLAVQKARFN